MRTLGKTERQTAPSWFRMVVSLLHGRLLFHSSPLVRPMRRDNTRRMNEDADHRCLWEDFHLLHNSSLLFALVRRCMDTTMRSCSVSSADEHVPRQQQNLLWRRKQVSRRGR